MHYYQHNIKDFNNATRHLTRVERALYRDSIELYYDGEQPLTSDESVLYRRLMVVSDDEKKALNYVLSEFFYLDGDFYRNTRCDSEIEKYHSNNSAKARAGKASAEARRKKKESTKEVESTERNTRSTHVQHSANEIQLNKEPITNNHKPVKEIGKTKKRFSPPSLEEVRAHVHEKGYSFDPEVFIAHYSANGWLVGKNKMKCWKSCCVTWNKRETKPANNSHAHQKQQTRGSSLEAELTDRAWAGL